MDRKWKDCRKETMINKTTFPLLQDWSFFCIKKRERLASLIFIETSLINMNLKYYAQCIDL